MLSDTTIKYLSALTYRADARLVTCWLPLGGIYWEDEIPNFQELWKLPEDDQDKILRLFWIRKRVWANQVLPDEDQELWETVKSQVPDWPLFQRLAISAEQKQMQLDAEEASLSVYHALTEDVDEFSSEIKDGVEHFSVTWSIDRAAKHK